MKAPFIRSPYNYDWKAASDAVATESGGPSLTVQSQSEDADINILMQRYGVTGKFPDNPRIPSYGDFSQVSDFRSALEAVDRAGQAFMEYPAAFRARFENNPQLFLDFCSDAGNIPAMRELGLLKENLSENAYRGESVSEPAAKVAAGGAPSGASAPGGGGEA